MKKAALYTKRVRLLFNKLKKDGGKVAAASPREPMEQLLYGILSHYTSESRAAGALSRLMSAVVDINELRVTPIADMVAAIGPEFPGARAAAQDVVHALTLVFNRLHSLDIGFLSTGTKKQIEAFLGAIEGINPHALALLTNRAIGRHMVPVDANMLNYLHKSGCVPDEIGHAQMQQFLSSVFKDKEADQFYGLLKRYSATHTPKRQPEPAASTSRPRGKKPSSTKRPARKKSKAPRRQAKKTKDKKK